MTEPEKLVPFSQALQMLNTGAEAQASLFIETYWQLKERLGREEAREILRKSMYEAYVKLGRETAKKMARTDARGMAEARELLYGAPVDGEGTKELANDTFIVEASGCTAYELMKRWGVSDEELAFLSDAFCAADDGFVAGFNPGMKFDPALRLMRGDGRCRWEHSTQK